MSISHEYLSKDLSKLLNLSQEYCCILNRDLSFYVANDALKAEFSRLSGVLSFDKLLKESDRKDVRTIIESVFTGAKPQEFVADFNFGNKQRKIRWRLDKDSEKELMFCFGSVVDEHFDQEKNKLALALDQLNLTLSSKDKYSASELTDIQNVLTDKIDKFKLISQNVSDIVCLHEPKEARYLYVSPSLQEVTGYQPSEFVGKSPYDFFHPDMHKMLEEDHKKKQQGGDIAEEEGPPPKMLYKILAKDGGYIWLESHSRPIFDDLGNVIMILSTSRDVTERVDAEEEKEKYYEYYRILGNNIPNGAVFLIDKDYRFLIAEGQEFKKLNRTPNFYLSKTIYEVYDKERLEFLEPYFETVIKKKKKVKFEYQHEGYDYTFLGSPFLDEEGQIVCGIFLTQNVTESKHLERQLRDTIHELEFQKSAMDSAALVSITDTNRVITYVNKRFCKITGYKKKELIGNKHSVLRSGHHDDRFYQGMLKTMEDGEIWHGEIKNMAKSGHYFWVDTYIIPFKDGQGEIIKYVFVRFDITDRKKTEDDLKARNYELDAFAYHTSHDLRAPLSSIMGLTDLISSEKSMPQIKQYNELINKSVVKLDDFIKSILTHSQNKNLADSIVQVSFDHLIQEAIDDHKLHKNFNVVKIEKLISGSGSFRNDEVRINIIFRNLIGNCIKYANTLIPASYLKISVAYNSDQAIIEIEDNGIGIRKEYLDKVFKMFYRANNRVDGSGLGLYIVKQTVDKLGGTIDIQSVYGEGTKIILLLPNLKN